MSDGPGARAAVGLLLAVAFACPILASAAQQQRPAPAKTRQDDSGCRSCHAGIEDMHPSAALGCVDCHGGNGTARAKSEAHVHAPPVRVEDERVLPLDKDLAWLQFLN